MFRPEDGGAAAFAPETVRTERLTLLPLRAEHADELAAALSDPALHAFIGGAPDDADTLRARYARWAAGSPDPAETWCNWAVLLRDSDGDDGGDDGDGNGGRLVGTVQATVTAGGRTGASAEIAWVLGSPWQRRGIAREAALGLVGWLRQRPVRTVVAHVHPDHAASAAVAAAAGLTRTDRWHDGEVRWELDLEPGPGLEPSEGTG